MSRKNKEMKEQPEQQTKNLSYQSLLWPIQEGNETAHQCNLEADKMTDTAY